MTPLTSFVLGLLASVSTCLVVVGGLVFSLSAKIAQDDRKNRRVFYLFHLGRVGGFAVLGGVLGALGGAIAIDQQVVTGLNLVVAAVMLLLGLNLIGVLSGKTLKLPRSIFERFQNVEHSITAPLVLGIGTFFFPCGFTQSAQVAALASGSFASGAAIMAAFAAGTLPMLLALSFGTVGLAETRYARYFFKTAGVLVLIFALITFWSSFLALGVVRPLSLFDTTEEPVASGEIREGVQYATINVRSGYTPRAMVLQAGIPTRLIMRARDTYDCSSSVVIPQLNYRKLLAPTGEETIDLGTHAAGDEIRGTCAMGMYSFSIRFR